MPIGRFNSGDYLSVEVDPAFKQTFRLKPLSRIFLTANLLFRSCIIPIYPRCLDGSIEEMKSALDRYYPQWREQQS